MAYEMTNPGRCYALIYPNLRCVRGRGDYRNGQVREWCNFWVGQALRNHDRVINLLFAIDWTGWGRLIEVRETNAIEELSEPVPEVRFSRTRVAI